MKHEMCHGDCTSHTIFAGCAVLLRSELWKKGTGSRLTMDTLSDVFAGSSHWFCITFWEEGEIDLEICALPVQSAEDLPSSSSGTKNKKIKALS